MLRHRRGVPVALAVVLVAASCAGGEISTETGEARSAVGGGVTGTQRITLGADPGAAYAEVDGELFVYEAAGSINYTCEISSDTVRVNFQTPDGQNLAIQAGLDTVGWSGSFSFSSSGDFTTQYAVSLTGGRGTLGVVDGALSYEGAADRIVDFDVVDADEVNVRVAVNCRASDDGGDPVAVIDGESFTFPLSGAQSVDCVVSAGDIDITINRLGVDDRQLSIDMRGGPDDWIGAVFIVTPGGNFTATLSGEAEGLTIDGDTVTYVGPIGSDDGDEVEANVAVTCP